MTYLLFDTRDDALARSARAWNACGYVDGGTARLWFAISHPTDGRTALAIPATAGEAQIGLAPEAYAALLSAEERAALVPALPPDWQGEA